MVAANPQWVEPEIWAEMLVHKREAFLSLWGKLTSNQLILAVSGPRRIGKSYLFKQLAAELVETGEVQAKNILYFPFSSNMDEPDIIKNLLDIFLASYAKGKKNKVFVFLDEVQFVSSWTDQVKFFYDQNLPIKFAVTGSTSLFSARKSKESLLGRLVKFPLGVLSFPEYLAFQGKTVGAQNRAELVRNLPILRSEFPNYLSRGQFPELALFPKIEAKEYLASVADQLINFDVPYLFAPVDRTLFTNLVKTLSFELGNEFSVNRLAKGLESDRRTIGEYVRILEETGYFGVCLNGFFRKMRAKLSASKKIYALNTNLALAINGFDRSYFNDSRVLGHYAENYVYLRLQEKLGPKIEYYSDKKKEVDFVTSDRVWEVKFGQIDSLENYQTVAKQLDKKLVIITENQIEKTPEWEKLPLYLL